MKIRKAVITAAGFGTRFLPATKVIPKPMLPVFDKPAIQYILEEIKEAGIDEVAIVVSPDSGLIEEHFSKAEKLEENLKINGKTELLDIALATRAFGKITYITQEYPRGLADAVYCAKDFVAGEPFALLMGDEIYRKKDGEPSCLQKMAGEYFATGASQVNTIPVFGDDISKYGNLKIAENASDGRLKVEDIIEKPTPAEAFSNYGSIGRYILSPKIFDYIVLPKAGKKGETYLTDALRALAKNDGLYACEFTDDRYDIGDKAGYVKATVEYALQCGKMKEELAAWLIKLAATL